MAKKNIKLPPIVFRIGEKKVTEKEVIKHLNKKFSKDQPKEGKVGDVSCQRTQNFHQYDYL